MSKTKTVTPEEQIQMLEAERGTLEAAFSAIQAERDQLDTRIEPLFALAERQPTADLENQISTLTGRLAELDLLARRKTAALDAVAADLKQAVAEQAKAQRRTLIEQARAAYADMGTACDLLDTNIKNFDAWRQLAAAYHLHQSLIAALRQYTEPLPGDPALRLTRRPTEALVYWTRGLGAALLAIEGFALIPEVRALAQFARNRPGDMEAATMRAALGIVASGHDQP